MKRKSKKETKTSFHRKSGLIIGFVILFLLAAVVFISLKSNKISPLVHNQPSTSTSAMLSPTSVPSIQSCSKDECVIKELGIKFTTPNGLNDLIYTVSENGASFSTKSLMNESSNCEPSEFPLGYLLRVNKSDLNESAGSWHFRESELKRVSVPFKGSNSDQLYPAAAKEFSNFYIVHDGPQTADCTTDQELLSSQVKNFQNIISNIELIK